MLTLRVFPVSSAVMISGLRRLSTSSQVVFPIKSWPLALENILLVLACIGAPLNYVLCACFELCPQLRLEAGSSAEQRHGEGGKGFGNSALADEQVRTRREEQSWNHRWFSWVLDCVWVNPTSSCGTMAVRSRQKALMLHVPIGGTVVVLDQEKAFLPRDSL